MHNCKNLLNQTTWALVVAMVNIVALLLCGLLPRLKLIDLFVKVDLCADVRAVAQTTQPKSGLSRLPPRLECVTSRPRDETIEPSRRRTSFRTFERYEQNVRIHIKPALGHIRLRTYAGTRFRIFMTLASITCPQIRQLHSRNPTCRFRCRCTGRQSPTERIKLGTSAQAAPAQTQVLGCGRCDSFS